VSVTFIGSKVSIVAATIGEAGQPNVLCTVTINDRTNAQINIMPLSRCFVIYAPSLILTGRKPNPDPPDTTFLRH
jgi:hypothetical protein